ncbi:hypothetical protein [Corynebacterium striatum]|nr:hypothetical protein [Corynebacterium striatum]
MNLQDHAYAAIACAARHGLELQPAVVLAIATITYRMEGGKHA